MAEKDSFSENFFSIREVLKSVTSTNDMKKHSLKKLSDLINNKDFANIFYNEFFFETLNLVFEMITFNTEDEDVLSILKNVLKSGPSNQTYLLLYNSTKSCTYEDIKFHKLSLIFVEFLKNGLIGNYLEKACTDLKNKDEQALSTFVQNVISTPVVMSNVYQKYAFYQEFYPENFFHIVSDEIKNVIKTINTRMSQNKDSSIFPLSLLVEKISLNGYGKIFWKVHLKNISEEVLLNYILRKIYQQMLYRVEDYCMKATIEALVVQLFHPQQFEFFFGDLTKQQKIIQVLEGFILNRFYSDITPLKCILFSISSYHPNKSIFINMFTKALESWANRTFIKHRSFEHTFYICQVIMICAAMLKKDQQLIKSATEAIDQCLLTGLPHYLSASLDDLRQVGMVVAVTLASLIPREGDKLQMPYKDNQLTKDLLVLAEVSDEFNRLKDETQNENDSMENDGKKISSGMEEMMIDVDSDDDDFIPLQTLEKPRSKKKPSYLGECLEGLTSTEDAELATESLSVCEELIEKYKESKFLHKELCDVLLHLEDRFGFEKFEELRMRSMLKLLLVSPELIADFLSGEFYAANYNLKQRCDVLHVLTQGAQNLSALDHPTQGSDDVNNDNIEASEKSSDDWKAVVAKRIDKKTRRFCSAKRNVVESKNKLSKFIGWFFYPLMSNFDKSDITINLLGQDHFVLEKLLMSLSRILYYAHNTFTAGTSNYIYI